MAKKYYAVRRGKQNKIVNSWEECCYLVEGVSKAEFKGFSSIEEAKDFMSGGEYIVDLKEEDIGELGKDDCVAYVDGSYNEATKVFGYGAIVFTKEGKKELLGSGKNEEEAKLRNVAGELVGVAKVILYAEKLDKKNLKLFYDYEGIEKWANGRWKTNKEFTKKYKAFMMAKMQNIKIEFIKVRAHSGDRYNEEADNLAKKSVGLE